MWSRRLRFSKVMDEMYAVQQKIAGILDEETRNAGVDMVYGKSGRVDGPQVFIGDEPVEAEATIIATGSRPNVPDIPGVTLPGVCTPHTIWGLRELPGRITIIGGSVMAAEFAYIFQTFGSRVTVLSRSGFLKDLDKHLRAIALRELDGVDIRERTAVTGIAGTSQVTGVRYRAGGTEAETEGGAVLLAAGLIPNSGMVSGIDKGPGGEILANDRMQTSVPGIYACGDVAGAPFLTPVARHEGIVAADNILGKERHMDYTHIPQAIFLAHELAFCGRGAGGARPSPFPGGPGRGPTGRCRTAIPGLQRSSLTRYPARLPACAPRGRAGSSPGTSRFSCSGISPCTTSRSLSKSTRQQTGSTASRSMPPNCSGNYNPP